MDIKCIGHDLEVFGSAERGKFLVFFFSFLRDTYSIFMCGSRPTKFGVYTTSTYRELN